MEAVRCYVSICFPFSQGHLIEDHNLLNWKAPGGVGEDIYICQITWAMGGEAV